MNEEELKTIEERASKATDGPWHTQTPDARWLMMNAYAYCLDKSEDAEFIAKAREDIPALIAEVRRLKEVIDDIGYERLESD